MKNNFTEPACSRKTVGFVQRHRKQIRFLMRVSVINMILLLSVSLQFLQATTVTGQNIDEIYITMGAENESLKDVLKKINEKTNLRITYLTKHVEPYTNISFSAEERSVREILEVVLEGTSLGYKQTGNYIFIERSEEGTMSDYNATSSLKNDMYGDIYTVTGTVIEEKNKQPIAGVNIIVKGTTRGTTTDVEGKFVIDVNDNDVLVFTFIGFKTFEAQVSGRVVIEVTLEEDIKSLQEVEVNAGYWNVKENERTGNISKVTAQDIEKQSVANPLQALEGRMPGVLIRQNTGVPGSAFSVEIRGTNSLRPEGNNPLYIVDGIPFTSTSLSSNLLSGGIVRQSSPLNAINPRDIKSIEVLKDADATAIYGSRGANGVVLITTKDGYVGKTKLDINVYSGFGEIPRKIDLLNTKQYVEMRNEAVKNDGGPVLPTEYDINGVWDTTRYTDWQEVLIGNTSRTTNAQVSISSGNANTQFLFSVGYYKETTVFPGDFFYQRGSGMFNINHTSGNQKFKINLTTNVSADDNNLFAEDLTGRALSLPPNAPELYNEDGSLNWANGTWGATGNPLAQMKKPYKSNTNNLITNSVVSYELIEGLQARTSIGFTSLQIKETALDPISSRNPALVGSTTTGSARFANNSIRTWIGEPQLEYQRIVGHGKMNLLIGSTFQESISESQNINTSGTTNDALLESIGSATSVNGSSGYTQYRYNAIFGRLNYNWNEKYIINVTGRRDGSSRFGPDKQFANFGAVGLAWIFSKTRLIKQEFEPISFGKLRASYGTTGSDQIEDYGYMDTHSATSGGAYQGAGLIPTQLVNRDYAWEINRKLEGAVELGFLEDRVLLAVSWYRNRSSNQLVGLPLPGITGFSTVQYNLPATVQNTGWEFVLNTLNKRSAGFSWTSSFNITIPQNKLIEYPNLESSAYANRYVVGKPITISKVLKYLGVDPSTGVYQFQDEDGNGMISTFVGDKQTIKNTGITFYGGVQNSIIFKNFKLDIAINFDKRVSLSYRNAFPQPGSIGRNQPVEVINRWREAGANTEIQKFSRIFTTNTQYNNWKESDQAYDDASSIRLQNVSLSWQIPDKWSEKLKLQVGRIYFQGQNLYTITNYRGLAPGYLGFLPPLRVVTFGIQLTF